MLAARNATAIYANQEAVELTRRSLTNAEKLDDAMRHKRVLMAELLLGQIHMTLSQFEDAADDLAFGIRKGAPHHRLGRADVA